MDIVDYLSAQLGSAAGLATPTFLVTFFFRRSLPTSLAVGGLLAAAFAAYVDRANMAHPADYALTVALAGLCGAAFGVLAHSLSRSREKAAG